MVAGIAGLTGLLTKLKKVLPAAEGFSFGGAAKGLAKDPLMGWPMMALGGQFAYENVAKPLGKGFWRSDINPAKWGKTFSLEQMELQGAQQIDAQMEMLKRQGEEQELQRSMARSAARLAAVSPHLYNQIMAGRVLPQGAVVLGGAPRTDLLQQLSRGMATGQLSEQPGEEEAFLASLGV